MFDSSPPPRGPVGALARAVDDLAEVDLSRLADDDLVAAVRALEVEANRLAAVGAALVAQLEARGTARLLGYPSTARLLSDVVRLHPAAARARVRLAAQVIAGSAPTGGAVPAALPRTAAALTEGAISARHAAVIDEAIDALPAKVAEQQGGRVEAFLADQARLVNPAQLHTIAHRLSHTLDPDGALATEADRYRRRELTISQRPDGSARLSGELDAIAADSVLTVLDPLARPAARAPDGEPDRRTPAQRRHDALREAMLMLVRSGTLPQTNGVSTTIVLTMSAEQLREAAPSRLVTTGHGALWTAQTARTLLGDAQVLPITLGKQREITAYGDTQRIFTQNQRLAMTARDGGCSFPGCVVPPAWCQAHHIIEFADGGPTSVANGALLCGFHHREHARLGWRCEMVNGRPHWRPPRWIDPERTLRQNTAHGPPADTDVG